MDLLKTPSIQSLLDSDLESVESLQYLDIEELDEVEYALPASESPTLAEVLSAEDDDHSSLPYKTDKPDEKLTKECSALQVEWLQGISQQLQMAQERSSAGPATALGVGTEGKLTVGTGHGHLLSFHDQTLRWVCDSNSDRGAVSCLSYNHDSTRLLAGFARGLIAQYETSQGLILRRITLGGETWGILQVTWAGTSGLALDTGGSVWLMKFSRPLGVRSARTSCLFSGARGEVVAMTARDARILALATLSRVIIVAGGRAAGVRLGGPPDTLPVLIWSETDDKVLVCGRAKTLQWLSVNVTGSAITLRPLQRVELKTTPLWLGWLGGSLAIFDSNECLRLWGDDYDVLDLSGIKTVYASVFYKGLWTDGRVSRAMCIAGSSAVGGACVAEGVLSLMGHGGIVRIKPRDILSRAQAFVDSRHYLQALRLLSSAHGPEANILAKEFILNISERPHILSDKQVADQAVKLCLKYNLSEELWGCLWDQCLGEQAFVEAVGDAAVRGDLAEATPTPDITQALIERLAEFEPSLVERVIASLPLTSLDPHRASVFTREKRLWRAVGAVAAALGGCSGAMRELVTYVDADCKVRERSCECAGGALVVAAADALAGRGAGGRALPDHARPSARHDALHTLLTDESGSGGQSPLRVMVEHDAASAVRLLEQCSRDPPFVGPLGKQNRLRVARALLSFANQLQDREDRAEILEFITGQLHAGTLPADREIIKEVGELARDTSGERADRAWASLAGRWRDDRERLDECRAAAADRPRVAWRLAALAGDHRAALAHCLRIERPSAADVDDLVEYVRARAADWPADVLEPHLPALVELRPRAVAAALGDRLPDSAAAVLAAASGPRALEFAEGLLEAGRLRGPAAVAHLRNLCVARPTDVGEFLARNAGIVRPEDALAIVRELGPPDAEPACLEAAGDPGAALEATLRLVAGADEESRARLAARACELCARVAPAAPPAVAADMWRRAVRGAGGATPALLVEAAAYLPAEVIAEHARDGRAALALVRSAADARRAWASACRTSGREAHETLARALSAARRGLAVRGACLRCAGALHTRGAVQTAHCARAHHADCEPDATCATCGRRLPDAVFVFPRSTRAPRPLAPPPDRDLVLVAPPRPDLEGIA